MSINGGVARAYFFGIIATAITFIIGLVDGLIRPLNCNDELLDIKGGFSASMINAVVRMGTILLEIGRSLGTVIRKIKDRTIC